MEEIFKIIESYGLTLVLLIGALYALYKFFFLAFMRLRIHFQSIMKKNAENMQQLKEKINIILEFIKNYKKL